MWIHEVAPERLAQLFHHYHSALMPESSSKGAAAADEWKEVSPNERNRMVTAARLALLELECISSGRGASREFFAQPGEAEWGC